jgi:hypothetical protein
VNDDILSRGVKPPPTTPPCRSTGNLEMTDTVRDEINELAGSIRALERQLELALAKRRIELNYKVQDGIVQFEQVMIEKHRLLKARLWSYVFGARPLLILTAPVIYSLIIPLVLLDLFAALYQAVCFPVYGIPRVRRRDYLAFDRGQLAYLNAIEKLNCEYCAYANGLVAYVREIASRTEEYWCPIKHARRVLGAHSRYGSFVDYGDGDAYRHDLERLRTEVRSEEVV